MKVNRSAPCMTLVGLRAAARRLGNIHPYAKTDPVGPPIADAEYLEVVGVRARGLFEEGSGR